MTASSSLAARARFGNVISRRATALPALATCMCQRERGPSSATVTVTARSRRRSSAASRHTMRTCAPPPWHSWTRQADRLSSRTGERSASWTASSHSGASAGARSSRSPPKSYRLTTSMRPVREATSSPTPSPRAKVQRSSGARGSAATAFSNGRPFSRAASRAPRQAAASARRPSAPARRRTSSRSHRRRPRSGPAGRAPIRRSHAAPRNAISGVVRRAAGAGVVAARAIASTADADRPIQSQAAPCHCGESHRTHGPCRYVPYSPRPS